MFVLRAYPIAVALVQLTLGFRVRVRSSNANNSLKPRQESLLSDGEKLSAFFQSSEIRISLRGNSEVKLIDTPNFLTLSNGSPVPDNKVVCKVLRYYGGVKNDEKLALFAAEAAMATLASQSGVGCPVYFTSTVDTEYEKPMIVMKKMEMGVGDAIRAGVDSGTLIFGLAQLFANLKESNVFWNDVTSPNNIMTDSTLANFGEMSRWYFIDFGTSVDTVDKYNEKIEQYAQDKTLYDQDVANWWSLLSMWANEGIINQRDSNRTLPDVDPQQHTGFELTNPRLFMPLSSQEQANLRQFKAVMKANSLWPEWLG